MRTLVGKVPVIGPLLRLAYRRWIRPPEPFEGSARYWMDRYASGGDSGGGSGGRLAGFKARILNDFVREQGIGTVIEFGCGDGRQVALADYPSYTGFDVSPEAIAMCERAFAGCDHMRFELMDDYRGETAELAISLDVVYHLVEDDVYVGYMNRLFDAAERFVIIYASDFDEDQTSRFPHVRHRRFTPWVRNEKPEWRLMRHVPNEHPYDAEAGRGSRAEFFVYAKI